MEKDFQVGDKIKVTSFFGKVICGSEVVGLLAERIIPFGGAGRRKVLFDTDRIYINKV